MIYDDSNGSERQLLYISVMISEYQEVSMMASYLLEGMPKFPLLSDWGFDC
jgi:hypothetical protein